jgi:hypothetical protein
VSIGTTNFFLLLLPEIFGAEVVGLTDTKAKLSDFDISNIQITRNYRPVALFTRTVVYACNAPVLLQVSPVTTWDF